MLVLFAEAEGNLSGSYSGMFVLCLMVFLSTVYTSHFFTCLFFTQACMAKKSTV